MPEPERPRFVLASASPARLAVLRAAGLRPEVIVSGVDEEGVDGGSAAGTALLLATRKAAAVAQGQPAGTLVLGCDSVLEFAGDTLGKPRDAADATARWHRMRGGEGVLHTGHALVVTDVEHETALSAVASTTVRFADVSDAEIAAYVATGEPLAVAGAFTLDGLGGWFVEAVDGAPSNVIGVSLPLLRGLLRRAGVEVTDLWG